MTVQPLAIMRIDCVKDERARGHNSYFVHNFGQFYRNSERMSLVRDNGRPVKMLGDRN
jgi:hypothetical protein